MSSKKIKKVLLLSPPLFFSDGRPSSLDVSVPPLGILYLASYINKYSSEMKAEVVDVAVEGLSLDEIGGLIKNNQYFAIGISSMTPQLQGTIELAKIIKVKFGNKIKIFLGGPHISADPDFINRFSDIFDYAITGEAEKTFLEAVETLVRGGKIAKLQVGEAIIDLDSIPFPDRTLIHREKYSQRESMMFSRGCPYQCYYCSRPAIAKRVRYRSAKNMIEEIKSVYKYCHGKIDFQDDTFNLNKKRVLEFCEAVQGEGLKLEWRCNARIDLIDKELLCAMKKAGCSLIHFGIESGNERMRREIIKKGDFPNEKIYEVFKMCRKFKIKVAGYFMIGHPGEGEKEIRDTRKMILNSGIDLLGLSIPTPFPGSNLYQIAVKRGVINQDIIDQFAQKKLREGYVGNYPVLVSEKLTKEYVFSEMKYINRKFYLNFKTLLGRLSEDIGSLEKLKKDIKDLLSLIIKGVSSRKPYLIKRK